MKRLNLLPRLKQQELAYERIYHSLFVAGSIAVAIVLFGVLSQIAAHFYLSRHLATIESEIEVLKRTANKEENAVVKKQIILTNSILDDFSNLAKTSPQWSRVLEAFIQHVPADVRVTNFTADIEKKQITIIGFSPTRDAVIDVYNNINADKEHFKDINYPLENVAQPTNVQFTFTFTIVDSVLSDSPIPAETKPAAKPTGKPKKDSVE